MKEMNRRDFLKTMGLAGTAMAATSLSSCHNGNGQRGEYDPAGTENGPIPTDQMTYREFPQKLGADRVSLLGYGAMRWPTMPNPDGEGEILDQEQINKLVKYAYEHGVNYFDSSPIYCKGESEKATGIALSPFPRHTYYIATKMSNFQDSSFDACVQMYRKSLEYFHTDYIDYYLLHSIGGGGAEEFKDRFINNGLLDFLKKEKEAGHIRHLGFSFHGNQEAWDFLMELHDSGECPWDFVQIQMNYVDWKNMEGCSSEYQYTELDKREIPVIIMEPLLGGRLSKLPQHVVARLKQQEPQKSAASWAFRFLGSFPRILTILSGMTYMEHLQDNLRSYCPIVPLKEEEMQFLYDTAKIINDYPTIPCNDCKYCMPCPYGLDIPAIFVHYNKCVNEGSIPESMEDPEYARMRKAFLVGYDRSVPKLCQANHCIGCGKCTKLCPQKIRIPRELRKIDQFVESLKQNTLGLPKEEKKG